MQKRIKLTLFCIGIICAMTANAHEINANANYLGNEGVMVEENGIKILFDPFFHNSFQYYTLVPKKMRQAIFEQKPPFDNIKLVMISHAHGDHFDKNDAVKYLKANTAAKLIAPIDAVAQIKSVIDYDKVRDRIVAIDIKKGATAQRIEVEGILVEAVRIPHAGWPKLAELSNIVYRVQMKQSTVVMHLGDADPDPNHFEEQKLFWSAKNTDSAFPPYWFALSSEGESILKDYVKATHVTGIHVPTNVPDDLKATGVDYFSKPGESREIKKSHQH